MAFRAFLVSAAAMALTTGCYFETIDDRAPGAPGDSPRGTSLRGEDGTCKFSLSTGCFDGYIASKQDFTVDDKSFLNADILATRFHELIVVEGQNAAGEDLQYGKDYKIELTTKVDNENFYSGFSYNLVGEVQRDQKLRTGSFSIDKLLEGSYDLRVQRAIKFVIVQNVTRQPDDGSAPIVEEVRYQRCATLYHDAIVDIRAGERTHENFNSFVIHVTDQECAADGHDTVIRIPNG